MKDSDISTLPHFIHIKPKKGWQLIDLKELKEYRDLFYFLVARDIKVRYKQTVLGGLWAIIQPFFSMVVFSLFFGKLAKVPSDGVPYPIFSFTAMIAWTYFSNAVTGCGNSLVGNTNLISKVYFPRIIIPITSVLARLLDFSIAFVILLLLMFYFHIYPTFMVLLLPLLMLLLILIASGVGTFLGALNAKYRDIQYVIPLLVQLWMFVSPVVYPTSMIPEKYRFIYSLNPLTGVIEGFRSILLGTVPFPTQMVLYSGFVGLILFIIGISYFKQVERNFADII
jgi:lipopolysaccharide transport system permease protein